MDLDLPFFNAIFAPEIQSLESKCSIYTKCAKWISMKICDSENLRGIIPCEKINIPMFSNAQRSNSIQIHAQKRYKICAKMIKSCSKIHQKKDKKLSKNDENSWMKHFRIRPIHRGRKPDKNGLKNMLMNLKLKKGRPKSSKI